MSTPFRPMLAPNKVADPDTLAYPMAFSFKLDGQRCLINEGGVAPPDDFLEMAVPKRYWHTWTAPTTRSMKPVENHFARWLLSTLPPGLDGELAVLNDNGEVDFRLTQSAVRSHDGEPDIRFFLFDNFRCPGGFMERNRSLREFALPSWCVILDQYILSTPAEVRELFALARTHKHEGLIGRKLDGAYKHNRATEKEAAMVKLKPKADAEGVVVGVVQGFTNTNEKTRDERGFAKRSSKKEGKQPVAMMGALILESPRWPGKTFEIGTGFDHATKRAMFTTPPIGEIVTFEFADDDVYDVPRTASYKGARALSDLGPEDQAAFQALIQKALAQGNIAPPFIEPASAERLAA